MAQKATNQSGKEMNVTQHKYDADQNYIKSNIKFVSVPFNIGRKPEEKKLYDWLRSKNKNISEFIKDLIRKEMEKAGN